jgi:hypothetical protein
MITLNSRPYLLIDDSLIERHEGTRLQLHHPRHEGPVLVTDAPWEGPTSAYFSIVEADDRWLMYYRGTATPGDFDHQLTCVAESFDGIEWERRMCWLFPVAGSTGNNVVWADEHDISHNMAPFLDTNPDCPLEQRFKAVGGSGKGGLMGLVSSDGIRWNLIQEEPIITEGAFDSLNLAFWDSAKGCYTSYYRHFFDNGQGGVRGIMVAHSDDFLNWSKPEWLQYGDVPDEHFYTNAIQPYQRDSGLYIGFPKRYVPERSPDPVHVARHDATGTSDCVMLASRDGINFPRRFMEAFIRPGLDQKNWTERNMMMATGMIRTAPDEFSLYWTEHYRHHDHRLVRGTIRVDGFASLHADWPGGDAYSAPVTLSGSKLALNYSTSVAGRISVGIHDENDKSIPGYGIDECDDFFGDDIEREVTWNGSADLGSLQGTTARLHFRMVDADVYSVYSL